MSDNIIPPIIKMYSLCQFDLNIVYIFTFIVYAII